MSKVYGLEDLLYSSSTNMKSFSEEEEVKVLGMTWQGSHPGHMAKLLKSIYADTSDSEQLLSTGIDDTKLSELVDIKNLAKEVNAFFGSSKDIKKFLMQHDSDIINNKESEIGKIIKFAKNKVKSLSGLIIPGGGNVGRIFYDSSTKIVGTNEYGLVRDLMEFALLYAVDEYNEAEETKIPVVGICRGGQLINVYQGGTLKNVSGQSGVYQALVAKEEKNTELSKVIEDYVIGYSCHHQAIDSLGKDVSVVIEHNSNKQNIVKAATTKDDLKWMLQFHPENYESVINEYKAFFARWLVSIGETKKWFDEFWEKTAEKEEIELSVENKKHKEELKEFLKDKLLQGSYMELFKLTYGNISDESILNKIKENALLAINDKEAMQKIKEHKEKNGTPYNYKGKLPNFEKNSEGVSKNKDILFAFTKKCKKKVKVEQLLEYHVNQYKDIKKVG